MAWGRRELVISPLPSPLPMSHHRRAVRVLDLEPVPGRAGLVGPESRFDTIPSRPITHAGRDAGRLVARGVEFLYVKSLVTMPRRVRPGGRQEAPG
jgi:hypothetical protein